MKPRSFYLLGFGVLLCMDTLAQLSFKAAAGAAEPFAGDMAWLLRVMSEPWIYVALGCYIGTFFTWISLLAHAPLGPAYAASHLEVVSVLALSWLIFKEPVSEPQIAGCALIVLGITLLAAGAERKLTDLPQRP